MEAVKYISLKHVCALYDKTPTQVRYAVETGRLFAEKADGGWEWKFPVSHLPSEWPEAPRNLRREEKAAHE